MPGANSKERAVYLAVSVAAAAGCLMGVGSILLYQRLRRDARGFVEPLRSLSWTRLAYSWEYDYLTPSATGLLSFVHWPFHSDVSSSSWSSTSSAKKSFTSSFLYPIIHHRRDMVALRRELDELRRLVENLREFRPPSLPKHILPSVAAAEDIASVMYENVAERRASSMTPSPDDDFVEFYDARSEELSSDYESPTSVLSSHSITNGHLVSPSNGETSAGDLLAFYRRVDALMAYEREASIDDRRAAYELMKQYYVKNNTNYEFMWRMARAAYLYGRSLLDTDETKRKELCFESKKYAFDALELNDSSSEVHKWCALTIGTLTDFVGVSQKLKDGYTFKIHIDKAIELKKDDSLLRHLSGRWYYGVASLSWIERNAASMLFGEVPKGTYEEGLAEFLEAERLKPDWKENVLYIALCYHNMGNKVEARRYLEKARAAPSVSLDDLSAEKDIEKLWQKYA